MGEARGTRRNERRRKGEAREIENTRAFPACSRLSNILLGRARLEIELCPLIEMINCLTSAAVPLTRPAAPRRDAPRLIAYLQIGNTKMCGIARTGGSGMKDGKRALVIRTRASAHKRVMWKGRSLPSLFPLPSTVSLSPLSLSSCHVAGNIVGYYEFAVFRGGRIETGIVNYSMIIAGRIVEVAPVAITSP